MTLTRTQLRADLRFHAGCVRQQRARLRPFRNLMHKAGMYSILAHADENDPLPMEDCPMCGGEGKIALWPGPEIEICEECQGIGQRETFYINADL